MAEASNRHVAVEESTDTPPPSMEEMHAAIRETRGRLAVGLARTADHVEFLFTSPSSAETEARGGGVVGGAIRTIAIAGRAKRAWADARRTGLLRRVAIGGVTVVIAVALAARARRRRGEARDLRRIGEEELVDAFLTSQGTDGRSARESGRW